MRRNEFISVEVINKDCCWYAASFLVIMFLEGLVKAAEAVESCEKLEDW